MMAALILLVSALVWAAMSAFALFEPRLRHWSAFWASAIIICLFSPVLGLVFLYIPAPYSAAYFDVPLLHGSLQALGGLIDAPQENPQGVGAVLWSKLFYFAGLIYLAGVCVMVARLVIGRLRVGQIAAQATQMSAPDVPAFWVTERSVGAFAYTTFGRHGGSKIVIPRTLMQSLSTSELADIVRHEAAHIQRRDDEWGVVLRFILAVCWASPFVYMLFAQWTMSAETQSDMAVNYGHPQAQRRAYAQTLLKALKITASRVWQYPVASFSTRHLRSEKMRIKHILTGDVPSFKSLRHRVLLSFVALGVTVSGALIFASSTPIRAVADNSVIISDLSLGLA